VSRLQGLAPDPEPHPPWHPDRRVESVPRATRPAFQLQKENLPAVTAVEVRNLRRVFKARIGIIRRKTKEVIAVDGISFDVGQGELFGLLGPNGAGKTTTVKMLATLLIPTAGSARVLGMDVVRQAEALRSRIGFVLGGERGACTGAFRPGTICATSPACTRWTRPFPRNAFPICSIWWGFLIDRMKRSRVSRGA